MSKFKKGGKRGGQAISTAALPDIVFMLLFFFMVTTVMRETELKIKVTIPKATELQKLERKSLVSYIYIGTPVPALQGQLGTAPRIQLNDAIKTPKDVIQFIEEEKESIMEAERPLMTVSLKVDRDCEMGIVTDVKQQLREANALKISYASSKTDDILNQGKQN